MGNLRITLAFVLTAIILFTSGCATIQRAKKVEELEREISQLTQLIKEKDNQINQLQGLLNDQEGQIKEREISHKRSLEKLYKELNEYKTRLKAKEEQLKLK